MKLVWALVFVMYMAAVVSIAIPAKALADAPIHFGKRLPQRSARSILSRMATGFGKRGSSNIDDVSVTVEDVVALMFKNPAIAEAIVRNFIDANDDGLISSAEMFSSKWRQPEW